MGNEVIVSDCAGAIQAARSARRQPVTVTCPNLLIAAARSPTWRRASGPENILITIYAASHGFNVRVLDVEAHGSGIEEISELINAPAPTGVALVPTDQLSARIAARLSPTVKLL